MLHERYNAYNVNKIWGISIIFQIPLVFKMFLNFEFFWYYFLLKFCTNFCIDAKI